LRMPVSREEAAAKLRRWTQVAGAEYKDSGKSRTLRKLATMESDNSNQRFSSSASDAGDTMQVRFDTRNRSFIQDLEFLRE